VLFHCFFHCIFVRLL